MKTCNPSVTQKSPVEGRQLELFNYTGKRHKPQILSTPGVSPTQRNRYRVMFRGEILGDRLSLDKALQLAQGGKQ